MEWRIYLGNGGDHIYFSLPFPATHELSDIYLQYCIWDNYLLFSVAAHVITRASLDEIYPPLEISFWLNIYFVLLVVFISDLNFPQVSGEFKLAFTLYLSLQMKQLT